MNDADEIALVLDAYARVWSDGGTLPTVGEFLSSSAVSSGSCTELAGELIKLDLELRWERGLRRLIEDYAADIDGLSGIVTPGLLLDEYRIRRQAGDAVSSAEYFRRFPQFAGQLADLYRLDPQISHSFTAGHPDQSVPPLHAGDRIDDFDLLAALGQGAFASVFLARQRSMQRLVALKVSASAGAEPQTLAQLDHEHIIRVYDQRVLPDRAVVCCTCNMPLAGRCRICCGG